MSRSTESLRQEIESLKRKIEKETDYFELKRMEARLRELEDQLAHETEEEQLAMLWFMMDPKERKDWFGF